VEKPHKPLITRELWPAECLPILDVTEPIKDFCTQPSLCLLADSGEDPCFGSILFVMADVTRVLSQIESGDPSAGEQLLPLVYNELRKLAAQKLAQEKPGQTLQATALVHDAYIRLVDVEKARHWDSRGHFFGAAAEAMRRILIESARSKQRLKRGGQMHRSPLDDVEVECDVQADDLLMLDEAITRLEAEDPEKAKIVQLRFFAGLSHEEAATVVGVSTVTAKRHWRYARAWLRREMCKGQSPNSVD
jgi:RNA polymerase sigma factor (TIGR02999 family)